jgi:tRNA dimethylallyltransferase
MTADRALIAVVGATATGKSALAVELAEAFDGEVVSVDAYAIYRGLDIGTAKPSAQERARVPHHLIDIVEPDERMRLARYLDAAQAALDDIWARGKLPVLAGGSGQYLWAILEGWQVPRVEPDIALREEFERLAESDGPGAVHERLAAIDPDAASRLDPLNTRRVIRALEVVMRTGLPLSACQTRQPIDARVLVLGLRLPRERQFERLDARVEAMFADGFVDEVEGLRAAGFSDAGPVRSGVGYKEISAYLDGEYDLAEAVQRTKFANHRLARRQAAWFRESDPRIQWVESGPRAFSLSCSQVHEFLDHNLSAHEGSAFLEAGTGREPA